MKNTVLFLSVIVLAFPLTAQTHIQENLQEQFILAENGSTIDLPEGRFDIGATLWLDGKKDITIRGAGMDKTILNFRDQTQGAEGIKVTNSRNIVLEDLTTENSRGDLIKTQKVDGITFRRVRTRWTGKPSKKNGAYGLYPVQCERVLIEECVAHGASDAGIYVGQSNQIVVRNSVAYENVAGIEIENSTMVDVYGNEAYDNTGGILVFDLPGLIQKNGGNVRVYDNHIHHNNHKNFAPKGNTVGLVPPGTGVLILAASGVEVFRNRIEQNRSFSLGITSYHITENEITDEDYDPWTYDVYIHDNSFQREKMKPTLRSKLGLLLRLKYKKEVPHIIYDGIVNEEHLDASGNRRAGYEICIRENENGTFGNLDAANGFEGLNRDVMPFRCERPALPASDLQERLSDPK